MVNIDERCSVDEKARFGLCPNRRRVVVAVIDAGGTLKMAAAHYMHERET
jgi:hypothetical protein